MPVDPASSSWVPLSLCVRDPRESLCLFGLTGQPSLHFLTDCVTGRKSRALAGHPCMFHYVVRLPAASAVRRERLLPTHRARAQRREDAAHADRLVLERVVGEKSTDAGRESAGPRAG